jgi:hypothetical protein
MPGEFSGETSERDTAHNEFPDTRTALAHNRPSAPGGVGAAT